MKIVSITRNWFRMFCAPLSILGPLMLLAGGCVTAPQAAESQALQRFEFRWVAMGVGASIVMFAPDEASATAAARAVQKRIEAIESVLSDYRVHSEVSTLPERLRNTRIVEIDPVLAQAAALAQSMRRRTGGAFDERLGKLTRLWRVARTEGTPPDPDRAMEAWESSRGEYAIDLHALTIAAEMPVWFDFGGIGKGLACDEAARVLGSIGITRYLIDLGGDLVLGDAPPGRPGWQIEIAALETDTITLSLARVAIATSGPRYQSLLVEGATLSHIIDPRRGVPVSTPRGVTVIAPDGATADALASALSVLGVPYPNIIEDEFPDLRWRIVQMNADGELVEVSSPAFKQ